MRGSRVKKNNYWSVVKGKPASHNGRTFRKAGVIRQVKPPLIHLHDLALAVGLTALVLRRRSGLVAVPGEVVGAPTVEAPVVVALPEGLLLLRTLLLLLLLRNWT
jgi:hypothetical protein